MWCFLTKDFPSEINKLFHWDVCQKLKMCICWLLLSTTFLKAKINPLEFEKSIIVVNQWPSNTLLAFYLILDNPLPALSNRTFHAMIPLQRIWKVWGNDCTFRMKGAALIWVTRIQLIWGTELSDIIQGAEHRSDLDHIPECFGILEILHLQGAQLGLKRGCAQTQQYRSLITDQESSITT